MTIARRQQIDPSVTRWYHCMTRCVRQAFLLEEDEGAFNRKEWIEDRLEELARNLRGGRRRVLGDGQSSARAAAARSGRRQGLVR